MQAARWVEYVIEWRSCLYKKAFVQRGKDSKRSLSSLQSNFLECYFFFKLRSTERGNDSMGDDDGQYFVSLEKSSSARSIAPVN